MARYTINHACGHTQDVQFVGKITERERRIAYMEQEDCPECRAAATNNAAAAAGLPELIGSDKQIAWANKIRQDYLKELAEYIADLDNPDDDDDEITPEELDSLRTLPQKQASSKWWIESRYNLDPSYHSNRTKLLA